MGEARSLFCRGGGCGLGGCPFPVLPKECGRVGFYHWDSQGMDQESYSLGNVQDQGQGLLLGQDTSAIYRLMEILMSILAWIGLVFIIVIEILLIRDWARRRGGNLED